MEDTVCNSATRNLRLYVQCILNEILFYFKSILLGIRKKIVHAELECIITRHGANMLA